MMRHAFGLLALILVCILGSNYAPQARAADCHTVKFIGVRGSGDPAPLGKSLLQGVSERLSKRLPVGTDYNVTGLDYTAVGIDWWSFISLNTTYQLSEHNGVKQLINLIHGEFANGSCPSEQIVLVGFSQGSHVIGDVLSNGNTGNNRLSDGELAHIKAVVLFADPRFNSQESFDHGSFRKGRNGILGARSPGDLSRAANGDHVRAWCRMDDPVCQGGVKKSLHDQGWYFDNYGDAAAAFAFSKLGFPKPPTSIYGGKLDVAFVIDTTSSMGTSIDSVKNAATGFASQLQASGADFQLGLVEFRDGDQGDPFAARLDLGFTANASSFQAAVNALEVDGGGDVPEYDLSGINVATTQLTWRSGAKKTIIVMTDAPYKDPEPSGGLTSSSVLQAARALDPAQIYPIVVGDGVDPAQFQALADGSGGAIYPSTDPAQAATSIAKVIQASIVAPVAALSSTAPVRPGESVDFNAGGSYDPSGDEITTYDWDFNGDGIVDGTTSTPLISHIYPDAFNGSAIVTVHSPAGTGSASTAIVVVATASHAPGAIATLTANASPPRTLAFRWRPPADDGGSPLTGYVVSVTPSASTDVLVLGSVPATQTSLTVPSLASGTYMVAVSAANDVGEGPATTSTLFVGRNAAAFAFRSKDGKRAFTWSGDLIAGKLSITPLSAAAVTRVRGHGRLGSPAFGFTVALRRLRFGKTEGAIMASRGKQRVLSVHPLGGFTRINAHTVRIRLSALYRNGHHKPVRGTLVCTFKA